MSIVKSDQQSHRRGYVYKVYRFTVLKWLSFIVYVYVNSNYVTNIILVNNRNKYYDNTRCVFINVKHLCLTNVKQCFEGGGCVTPLSFGYDFFIPLPFH